MTKVLVAVKRVLDFNVKPRVRGDGTGVELLWHDHHPPPSKSEVGARVAPPGPFFQHQRRSVMDNPSKLFDDIAKLAQQYKRPGIDIDAVLQGRRKDVETLLEVGRIAQSGAESLAQKQAEMLRASLEDLRSVLSAQANTEGGKPDAVRQAAEKAIGNVGELAQIALKSQSAAFDAVRQRAQENINELKALLSKAK